MSNFVYISSSHPLSMTHVHRPALLIQGQPFGSFLQAYWFIACKQDRIKYLGEQIKNDSYLYDNPAEIRTWASKRGYFPSGALVFGAHQIFEDLVTDQVSNNVFLRAKMNHVIQSVERIEDVRFVVCGNNEYLWSVGLRESAAISDTYDDAPGYNVYGTVLDNVLNKYAKSDNMEIFGVQSLLSLSVTFPTFGRKSVLLISDSICRQFKRIDSGTLVVRGGGTFSTLTDQMNSSGHRFCDHEFVIINIGINDVQKPEGYQRHSWEKFWRYVRRQIRHGFRADHILISLPIPHPSVHGVEDYSDWIESKICASDTPDVEVLNWNKIWPIPFVEEGEWNPRLYEYDNFHLCHAGLRTLWEHWVDIFELLKYVGYSLGPRY